MQTIEMQLLVEKSSMMESGLNSKSFSSHLSPDVSALKPTQLLQTLVRMLSEYVARAQTVVFHRKCNVFLTMSSTAVFKIF